MTGEPEVSVVIATYNYSAALRYAIETVRWQTFGGWELIVVGDCCTDDSEQVVASFADPRIRWLNLAENSGSKSLPQNAGIGMARAPLIAYLAHDDLWHPEHLATLLPVLKKKGADFVHSVAVYVPPPGNTQRDISGVFPEGEFRAGHALVHSSVLHRKEVIARIGGWPDYRTTQMPGDHLFWTRAAESGLRFVGVPKLTVWKFNASSRKDSYVYKRSDEQARYFELIRHDPELVERELIDVARSAMAHGVRPLEIIKPGRDAPPGSFVQQLRRIRGLEATEPMLPLEIGSEHAPFAICFADCLPAQMRSGEKLRLEVRLQNDSAFTLFSHAPHPVHFAYHWLRRDGSTAVHDGERSPLIPPLPARSALHYFVTIAAPDIPGIYTLQPALVQEGVRWFENGVATLQQVEVSDAIATG